MRIQQKQAFFKYSGDLNNGLVWYVFEWSKTVQLSNNWPLSGIQKTDFLSDIQTTIWKDKIVHYSEAIWIADQ